MAKSNIERAREMLDREAERILKSAKPTAEMAAKFTVASGEVSDPDVSKYLARRSEAKKQRVRAKNVLAAVLQSADEATVASLAFGTEPEQPESADAQ